MSRHSKSYGRGKNQCGAGLQFDRLLKSCSNSKKPSANKTAGAIGRFGIASFTSTRNSSIDVPGGEEEERFKFAKKRPKLSNVQSKDPFQFGTSHNSNVMTGSPYQMTTALPPPIVRPRKFFKSRGPLDVGESIGKPDPSSVRSDIMIPPIKIPVPKPSKPKLKSQSSEKSLKTLRNATNVSPPTSQPIKLRIFKDKTTSKLVSVSEAPPPIIDLEHHHHLATKSNKPEKIPKKRGRKPKNLLLASPPSINPVTCEPPPPALPLEKKPPGRLTRNSRKQQEDQDHSHFSPQPLSIQSRTRTSNSSIDAMPILSRAESRDSTEDNLGSENSTSMYASNIFLHGKIDSSSHNTPSSNLTAIDNKKLEDDAEFQQLSQMLSSMEEGSDTDYHHYNKDFQHQNPPPNLSSSSHHHHLQQQQHVLHSQPAHLPYNNPQLSELYSNQFPSDKLESLEIPTSTRSLGMHMPTDIIPSTGISIPPPPKVRDAQDIRAILEDDWDESFDEDSPKKSPPKTSRFDLSAFMQESSSSGSTRSTSPHNSSSSAFLLNQPGQSSMLTTQHGTGGIGDYSHSYSHHQQQQQQHHSGQFMDHHHSQLAPPFNAPYAVRNLLSTPQDFQQQAHSNFHTPGDMSSQQLHHHHQVDQIGGGQTLKEEEEILMKESLESDKLSALNLSLTTTTTSLGEGASSSSLQNYTSTKKGSSSTSNKSRSTIFKSRALSQSTGVIGVDGSNRGNPKKRLALYKHKFGGEMEVDEEGRKLADSTNHTGGSNSGGIKDEFDEDSDVEDLASMRRVATGSGDSQSQETGGMVTGGNGSKVVCKKNTKKLFTVIRNVKPIHELQESGEFHEFDGDVWYILEDLKDKNPMTNRCLSAVSLAMRCMEPAFRMHLRAHGTVAEFCKELHDSPSHPVLALLASTVLFVLSQDRLNMDLDTDSLRLIIALAKSEQVEEIVDENPEIMKHRQRVINLVSEMKDRGHAKHLKLEKITASELALETLLYLTSKRAGEWVKHELRNLGGLDYIVTEVVASLSWLRQEFVGVGWSEAVIERLWKIDRCLRVLQQVTFNHEENQRYLLGISTDKVNEGVDTPLKDSPQIFVTLFRYCSDHLSSLSKEAESATVIREILFSVLRVLVNLSHDYRGIVLGSEILCRLDGFLPLCLHSVFHLSSHIPDEKIFDLLMHSLCMLLNLVEHSKVNRAAILSSTVRRQGAESLHSPWSNDSGVQEEQPTLNALVEMFARKERAAQQDEASTDDILTKGSDSQKDSQGRATNSQSSSQNSQNSTESESTNSVQDTIDKLIQTAGKHMENSLIAAYVSLLLAYLIMDDPISADTVRNAMPNCKYLPLMIVLKKLFNFMSITSSASGSLRGLKATSIALKFYAKCDPASQDELKKIIPD